MNTVITNPQKQLKEKSRLVSKLTNIINTFRLIKDKDNNFTFSDHIFYLLKASENSNPKTKSKIENHLVKMGQEAVPSLVEALTETKGTTRGLAAMVLIRIGTPSISSLRQIAADNHELGWIADYIIREIKGTEIKLTDSSASDKDLKEVLVG